MRKSHGRVFLFAVLAAFIVVAWMYANGQGLLLLMMLLMLVGASYILGLIRLWRKAGPGHGIPIWRALCFLAGLMILIVVLSSPVDALADKNFSVHMIQHMLLMKIVAPLLLLGEFSSVFLWAVGLNASHKLAAVWKHSDQLQAIWKRLLNPWLTWALFAFSLWLWHIPDFFQAALKNEALHDLEHFLFLSTSLLFWWYLIQNGSNPKVRYGTAVLYLFTTGLHESALGALLTFSSASWYSLYSSVDPWGLSVLKDQQLAGVIMWLPSGIMFTALIVVCFGLWLQAIEKSSAFQSQPELTLKGDSNE